LAFHQITRIAIASRRRSAIVLSAKHHLSPYRDPRNLYPADYGWDLWVTYAVTVFVVVSLYPACLWFSRLKARRRDWWLSYL